MKLTYRGKQYESAFPAVDVVESELTGKYRGQSVHFHYPRHIPGSQSQHDLLKYRGVSYTQSAGRGGVKTSSSITSYEAQPATSLFIKADQVLDPQLTQVHAANLCRLLERRRQAALERGDESLLKLLDWEAQHIAC